MLPPDHVAFNVHHFNTQVHKKRVDLIEHDDVILDFRDGFKKLFMSNKTLFTALLEQALDGFGVFSQGFVVRLSDKLLLNLLGHRLNFISEFEDLGVLIEKQSPFTGVLRLPDSEFEFFL